MIRPVPEPCSRAASHLLFNDRDYPERQVDVLRDAVAHQLKLAVRRDKCDGAISVKLAELHAAVELNIVELDARLLLSPRRRGAAFAAATDIAVDLQLVVEAQLALRHSRQHRLHLHLTRHVIP